MPRTARRQSGTGVMHVIVRGIGKQILFEENDDYRFFIAAMKKFSGETDVSIWAFCLMENHVHMLVRDQNRQLPLMMKKLGVSYSQYFNRKYERTGHLFQDRYLSEPVEDEKYLLNVFRYILNNPQKAGICPGKDYRWSSYKAYGNRKSFVDTALLEELIGSWSDYAAYVASEGNDRCMEYETFKKDDAWAQEIISRYLGGKDCTSLKGYSREERDKVLRCLKKEGLTIRQVERLTGISRNIIQRVWAESDKENRPH